MAHWLNWTMMAGPLLCSVVVSLLWSSPHDVVAAEQASGRPVLQQLIDGARREGNVRVTTPTSFDARRAGELTDAFKRRFGLDIKIKVDFTLGGLETASPAIAEHKAGIRPSYDVRYFTEEAVFLLKNAGAVERIENWATALAEIDPKAFKVKDRLSPYPLDGYGFTWGTRTQALLYNPKLMVREKLPKTMKEYGNPRYKGMFSVPPWITRAMVGPAIYDKGEWLEIVRSWGRNKAHVVPFTAGLSRMLLGELSFLYANEYQYFEEKAKDADAPIGLSFFEDLPWMHLVMNAVLKGTPNPNAAKLFALWTISEEGSHILEKHSYTTNVILGTGPISREVTKLLKERSINPMTWFDSQKTLDLFLWYETKDGIEYSKLLDRAQREGR
jgi:ABC-type Fe3+ transport system substrate-binding protein